MVRAGFSPDRETADSLMNSIILHTSSNYSNIRCSSNSDRSSRSHNQSISWLTQALQLLLSDEANTIGKQWCIQVCALF
jgi:hypothetical protein